MKLEEWLRELVSRLRTHLGEASFDKFVDSLNSVCRRRGRLVHWQEKAWDRFIESYPEYKELDYGDIFELVQICQVHNEPLIPDEVPVVYRPRKTSASYVSYIHAAVFEFPHANLIYKVDSPGKLQGLEKVELKYCAECRRSLLNWNEGREETIGLP